MQKQNLFLYKSLVESDFLIVEKHNCLKAPFFDKKILLDKNSFIGTLDIFSTIKSLKQFISIVQFVKKNTKVIHLIAHNKQNYHFLKQLLLQKSNSLQNLLVIHNSLDFALKGLNTDDAVLILDDFYLNNSLHLIKRLVSTQSYLIQKINTNVEKNLFGSYKLFNDFKDYKKLLFLVVLIEQIHNS